jgi:hypothetical protein
MPPAPMTPTFEPRRMAWPASPHASGWYEEQEPVIAAPEETDPIDPFELDVEMFDQSLGFGLDGLRYCLHVLARAMVIDFVDSILERSRRPNSRGSLRCVECGLFVGRRALGYGQLYCTERCKKRAAKRRYRARAKAVVSGSRLHLARSGP